MRRPSGRRWAAPARSVALLAVVVLGVSGCTGAPDGRYYPSDVDIVRARAVWNDPWVAPTQTSTAGTLPEEGRVSRDVGKREGYLSGDRDTILQAQLDSARAHGWRLVAASCKASGESAALTLAKGGAGEPDGQALATFGMTTLGAAEGGGPVESPDGETLWDFSVAVSVPHHLEDAWPATPAVELAGACRSSVEPLVELPPDNVWAGDRPGDRDVPKEPASASSAATRQRADLANADPVIQTLGLDLASFRLSEDIPTQPLSSPSAEASLPPATELTDVVSDATGQGWTLTYTRCGSGQVAAELRRSLSDTEAVTLRLTQEPDPERDGALGVVARAVATSTALAGPPPAGEPVGSPCWSKPSAEGIATQGVPWFGPTELQRVQSSG